MSNTIQGKETVLHPGTRIIQAACDKIDTRSEQVLKTFHLDNHVYIQIIEDQGEMYIDIREWFQNEHGAWIPTRKGIHLTCASWLKLLGSNEYLVVDMFNITKKQQVDKHYALGGGIYASVTSPQWKVDLYLWYVGKDGILKRGWKGISFSFAEWRKLTEMSNSISPHIEYAHE